MLNKELTFISLEDDTFSNVVVFTSEKYYDEMGFQTIRHNEGKGVNTKFNSYSKGLSASKIPIWIYMGDVKYQYYIGDMFYTVWEGRDQVEFYITKAPGSPNLPVSLKGKISFDDAPKDKTSHSWVTDHAFTCYMRGSPSRSESMCYVLKLNKSVENVADKIRCFFKTLSEKKLSFNFYEEKNPPQ